MPKNQPDTPTALSFTDRFYRGVHHVRSWVAQKLVSALYGQSMYISSQHKGAVASCVVFWYIDGGVRKFVMTRPLDAQSSGKAAQIRFIGCMSNDNDQSPNASLARAIKNALGDVFYKALDPHLLDVDRIAAVPMLSFDDPITSQPTPVQSLCWAVQITPEQAQLCAPIRTDSEVIAVPEHALLGPEIATAHKLIYQSVLRHIHHNASLGDGLVTDKLDELLKRASSGQRTIH